jgi:hypothetical protein
MDVTGDFEENIAQKTCGEQDYISRRCCLWDSWHNFLIGKKVNKPERKNKS